jgi:nitric oxide reductase large subunit
MEHGTLWGHGAYLGPDYSAEYLHRLAEICNDLHARERFGRPVAELPEAGRASRLCVDGAGRTTLDRTSARSNYRLPKLVSIWVSITLGLYSSYVLDGKRATN